MALHTYRYVHSGPNVDIATLKSRLSTGSVATVGAYSGLNVMDLANIDDTELSDLNAIMALAGWTYVSTDPTDTPFSYAVAAIAGAPLVFGAGNVATTTTARYLIPGNSDAVASAVAITVPVTRDGTLRRLRVKHMVAGAGANSIVYTVYVNGSASGITVTVAPSSTTLVADTTNTVAVVAGDLVTIAVTKPSGTITTSPTRIVASLEVY